MNCFIPEFLCAEKIRAAIETPQLALLAHLEIFETISSTNTYLLEQHLAESSKGWICLAEQQTKGRGRQGKEWFSPDGSNIYCSILWKFPSVQHDLSGLSIAAAVMVIYALTKYGIGEGLQLKWPNDILFLGRKLAGILIERRGNQIVLGVGINVCLPEQQNLNWIDLKQIGKKSIARNYLAGLLINELLANLLIYQQHGVAAFIDPWRQYDFLLNKNIMLHTPEKKIPGVMRGINQQGELIFQPNIGEAYTICYGEISVRPVD